MKGNGVLACLCCDVSFRTGDINVMYTIGATCLPCTSRGDAKRDLPTDIDVVMIGFGVYIEPRHRPIEDQIMDLRQTVARRVLIAGKMATGEVALPRLAGKEDE